MSDLVSIKNLTFIPQGALEPALNNVSLSLPNGSRTLLVGANGGQPLTHSRSRSSPLSPEHSREIHPLADPCRKEAHQGCGCKNKEPRRFLPIPGRRNLPGHRMVSSCDAIRFNPVLLLCTICRVSRAMNPVVRSDIVVSHFLDSVGGYRYKERRDHLLDLLDVDLDWRMHNISDGERRRVQLCMGLMAPWDILLLDEVTVDLDVLVRHELLAFLKQDSEARGATIICKSPSFPFRFKTSHTKEFSRRHSHIRWLERFPDSRCPPPSWRIHPTTDTLECRRRIAGQSLRHCTAMANRGSRPSSSARTQWSKDAGREAR